MMHDFQEHCQTVFHAMLCLFLFFNKQYMIKQFLDSVFVISGIIKVSVSVSASAFGSGSADNAGSTLIIPDITINESNNCLLLS